MFVDLGSYFLEISGASSDIKCNGSAESTGSNIPPSSIMAHSFKLTLNDPNSSNNNANKEA
jgi:hypothetical protein